MVECKDLDEAISIAVRIPTVRVGGSIEVRPVESPFDRCRWIESSLAGNPASWGRPPLAGDELGSGGDDTWRR